MFYVSPRNSFQPVSSSTASFSSSPLPVLPESLLTRRVPDLQLDPLSGLDLHQAGEEVHADRGIGDLSEATLGEPADQTRLPYRGVPDDDQPELVEPDGLHVSVRPPVCRCRSLSASVALWALHRCQRAEERREKTTENTHQ